MSEQTAERGTAELRMSGRWLLLAWAGWLALVLPALGLLLGGLPLLYTQYFVPCADVACGSGLLSPEQMRALRERGVSLHFYAAYDIALIVGLALVCFAIGGLLAWRRPRDPMALFVALTVVLLGASYSSVDDLAAATHPVLLFVNQVINNIGFLTAFLFFYFFPDGHIVPRWTRWMVIALIVTNLLFNLLSEQVAEVLFVPLASVFLLTGVFAQVYRYRRVSGPIQRLQTKWVIFGFSAAMTGFVGIVSIDLMLPQRSDPLASLVLGTILYGAMTLIPLSIGMAMLRYRLYDIDIIIRRTLVYSLLTITLGLVYVGCILLTRALIAPLTGSSEVAIVASTLAIAALFTPLRRRIQNLIDKRFYRRKYDAAKVLAAFGATARDETDLEQLTNELLLVVDETMQPEFVGLWLKPVGDRKPET